MFWMVIILSLFSVGHSHNIGKIQDHIMIGVTNNSLFNLTENQCLCQMMQSNELASAVNYFQTNQTCQLFNYNISLIFIQYDFNSSFIFINQSWISITNSKLILNNTFGFWNLDLFKNQKSKFRKSWILNSENFALVNYETK
jgi:hypothetical protein